MVSNLDKQIEHILSLEPDFDGEGSPAYKRETIDKAIKHIDLIKDYFLKEKGFELGEPRINPGPDGSIDIHWKNISWKDEQYEILMNVPIGDEPTTYYGDNNRGEKFKGELKLDN